MEKISTGSRQDSPMVDEMLDGSQMELAVADPEDSGLSGPAATSSLLSHLTANDRIVHADFQKHFDGDFFNDQDLK